MKGQRKSILPLCVATVLCSSPFWLSSAQAKTIYQYIDQQGAVTFSDAPPDHTNNYVVLDIPDPPTTDSAETEQQLDEMIAVTRELEAKRKADEAAAKEKEQKPLPEVEYYPEPEEDDRDYYDFYPNYYWGYHEDFPHHPHAKPPYRDNLPDNPTAERLERLKTPIRIPQFGTGEPLHERLEPFNPPLHPKARRQGNDSDRR